MKKLFLSFLCVLLAFSLMACGGNKEPVTDPSTPSDSQESTDATVDSGDTTEGDPDTTTEGEDAPTTEGKDTDATNGKDTSATAGKDTDATTGKDTSATNGKDTTTGIGSTPTSSTPTSGKTEPTKSEAPSTTKPKPSSTTATKTEASTSKTTKTEDKPTKPTKPTGTKPAPSDNVVNWEDVFGTDPTTTTTTKKGETTTTTTTTTTESTTTTTVAPTVVEKVLLPAVGTDVDVVKQKGRIRISAIDLKGGKLSVTIKNESKNWITEETDYVRYACYDKDGKELKGKDDFFGYFYLGCLEVGEEETFTVNLPAGTAEVKLVDSKIVYWTEWS